VQTLTLVAAYPQSLVFNHGLLCVVFFQFYSFNVTLGNTRGKAGVQLTLSLTSDLDDGGWSTPWTGRFTT
jgi:hypothetical protein